MNKADGHSNYLKFEGLLKEFEQLQPNIRLKPENKLNDFIALTKEYSRLIDKVYLNRCNEVESLLSKNSDKIIFSSFELMEHDFRENSHSNILRYIFHYKFWDKGKEVLSKFIEKAIDNNEFTELIINSKYEIYREFVAGNGRIDLLIEDKLNKFVIVIENKILASISVKEYAEDNTISRTQIDNYVDYISDSYKGYKKCFILLSLISIEDIELREFIKIDYTSLLKILNSIDTKNNIVDDYRVLLKTITTHQYDKELLLELHNKLKNKERINSLNTFEIANKYFQ